MLYVQASSSHAVNSAVQQLNAKDAQAELESQIAAAEDQLRHMKGRMHETNKIMGTLLDSLTSRKLAAA